MARWSKGLIDQINQHNNIETVLEMAGIEPNQNRLVFCPFHDNTHTPSAKVYPDGNALFCFAEQRRYSPFDVMKDVLGWDFDRIVATLPEGTVLDFRSSGHEDSRIRIPLVDAESAHGFDQTGDLGEFLSVLGLYWKHKDELLCEEF